MKPTVRLTWVLGSTLLAGCLTGPGPAADDTDTGTSPTPTLPGSGGPERLCAIDVTCYGTVLDEPKAPCSMTVTDADGTALYDGLAGFELRGRSSLTFPKPQYDIELRAHTQLEVWPGATWQYLDDGSDPGAGWQDVGYDDARWSVGPAPLGYAVGYLSTVIRPSVTAYFRHAFEVDDPAASEDVALGFMATDGLAIYLNGVEVFRDGVPVGATWDTWGTSRASAEDATRWFEIAVDPALLVAGANVLAVEVHQSELAADDLRFDLYLDTSTETEADFFGMGGDGDWILNGQYVDRALYRNRFAYDVFQSFGGEDRYAPESRFCELTLNGEYRGVYTLGEQIERGNDRLDLDNDGDPGETFLVKLDDEEGFHTNAVGYGEWQLEYPKDPDALELAAVSAFLGQWEAAVTGPDPADPDTGIFGLLDLESTVDFVILQELTKNIDAYQLSVHLWKEPGGKMHFTPWDFDLSMGYPNDDCGAEGWVPRDTWVQGERVPITWSQEIAAVPAFRAALVERWRALRETVLAEDSLLARIDAYRTTLDPAIGANFDAWPIGDIAFTAGGTEDLLCPVGSYDDEHARTVDFLRARLAWMDANIDQF